MSQNNSNQECEEYRPSSSVDFAENRRQRKQFSRLQEAFQAINEDTALAKEFSEKPLEVMKKFDVNTRHIKVHKSQFGADIPAINQTGVFTDKLAITICGSVGLIVCATVGDDF